MLARRGRGLAAGRGAAGRWRMKAGGGDGGRELYKIKEIDFYEYDEDARRLLRQGAALEELIAELCGVG